MSEEALSRQVLENYGRAVNRALQRVAKGDGTQGTPEIVQGVKNASDLLAQAEGLVKLVTLLKESDL